MYFPSQSNTPKNGLAVKEVDIGTIHSGEEPYIDELLLIDANAVKVYSVFGSALLHRNVWLFPVSL